MIAQSRSFIWLLLATMILGAPMTLASSPHSKKISTLKTPSSIPSIASQLKRYSLTATHLKSVIQLGGFVANQGRSQSIEVDDLAPYRFELNKHKDSNGLAGLGFYTDGLTFSQVNLLYGINAFYLAKTISHGIIIQENQFSDLAYQYSTTNLPIYLAAKAIISNTYTNQFDITVDLGIGPNLLTTSTINSTALKNNIIPEQTYSGRTTVTLSASAGVGIRLNQLFDQVPIECGYRFFYLGHGKFHKISEELLSQFNAGNATANALLCSVTI